MCMLLQMLDRAGRSDEAIPLALESLDRPDATPVLLIAAAGALRTASRLMDEEEARPLLEQAADGVMLLLRSQEAVARLDPEGFYVAIWLLASFNDTLGHRDEALRLYSILISLNPKDPDAYAMRGHLLMELDEKAALEDYRVAVGLDTHAIAPYLVLTNQALKGKRYKEAYSRSLKILSFKEINQRTKAAALEFLAIASFELGGKERAKAVSFFEQAIAFDPHNERMRQNFGIVSEKIRRNEQPAVAGSIRYPELLTALQLERDTGQTLRVPSSAIAGLDRGIQRDMAALV
jgi:tetratricopeptide (TPR) repeat protein